MATNNDNKIFNAIRLHLVLVKVANEAVQFKLTEIIEQKTTNNHNSDHKVQTFLAENYQANTSNRSVYLNGFFKTLDEKFG